MRINILSPGAQPLCERKQQLPPRRLVTVHVAGVSERRPRLRLPMTANLVPRRFSNNWSHRGMCAHYRPFADAHPAAESRMVQLSAIYIAFRQPACLVKLLAQDQDPQAAPLGGHPHTVCTRDAGAALREVLQVCLLRGLKSIWKLERRLRAR